VKADQVAIYDDGVGADGTPIEKVLGGAFGTGLYDKIKRAYTQIAHVYEAGDELFLFGFSRGAYTARSLAGMIAICGLPSGNFDDEIVETAFQAYRHKDQRATLLASLKDCGLYDAKITMLGVWDTVGSLGIPAIFGGVSQLLYGFLDSSLNPKVLHGYHAVAIDERRVEFPATLWTSVPAPGQTVEQVWFCGVHCDVGGGYADDADSGTALSDITLAWIMSKACALGLQINSDVQAQYTLPLDPKYALDQLHESWNPIWGFPKSRTIDSNASLSDSVVVRCQHDAWQPRNIKLVNGIPAPDYLIAPIVSQPAQPVTVRVSVAGSTQA
jgi:uncharacterized protein (DUF2235 family)